MLFAIIGLFSVVVLLLSAPKFFLRMIRGKNKEKWLRAYKGCFAFSAKIFQDSVPDEALLSDLVPLLTFKVNLKLHKLALAVDRKTVGNLAHGEAKKKFQEAWNLAYNHVDFSRMMSEVSYDEICEASPPHSQPLYKNGHSTHFNMAKNYKDYLTCPSKGVRYPPTK